MLRYLGKLTLVLAVCTVSVITAVYFTGSYVNSVSDRQKGIADAILEAQLQAAMKEAGDIAKAELDKENPAIETAVLETKPLVTSSDRPAETLAETTSIPETSVTATETVITPAITETKTALPERVTDYKTGGLLDRDRTGVKIKTIFTLSPEEAEELTEELTEHYFLNGFLYAQNEQDPVYKKDKQLAAEMQSYVSETLSIITGTIDISDVTKLLSADYSRSVKETEDIKNEFIGRYSEISENNKPFDEIYDFSIAYFDRLIKALNEIRKTADSYKNAPNPLLAIGIAASSVDNVIMPEILAVLENSFDIVEITHPVYLDGTTGAWLLTREEVRDIIINPGLIQLTINK